MRRSSNLLNEQISRSSNDGLNSFQESFIIAARKELLEIISLYIPVAVISPALKTCILSKDFSTEACGEAYKKFFRSVLMKKIIQNLFK